METKISPKAVRPIPKQWIRYISNTQNKSNLVAFLCYTWCKLGEEPLKQDEEFLLAGGFSDTTKAILVTCGKTAEQPDLKSDHEEADTLIVMHTYKSAESYHSRKSKLIHLILMFSYYAILITSQCESVKSCGYKRDQT